MWSIAKWEPWSLSQDSVRRARSRRPRGSVVGRAARPAVTPRYPFLWLGKDPVGASNGGGVCDLSAGCARSSAGWEIWQVGTK